MWNNPNSLPEEKRLAQSKGMRNMLSLPGSGDIVNFVSRGHVIMRGIVESNGFQQGTSHHDDPFNRPRNPISRHRIVNEFVWIKITHVNLNEPIRPTGQATWATMPT